MLVPAVIRPHVHGRKRDAWAGRAIDDFLVNQFSIFICIITDRDTIV